MELKLIAIIVVMTAVTYGARLFPILAFRGKKIEGWLKDFLELIPVALLAVLIIPELFTPEGKFSVANPYLLTGILTFIFAKFLPNLFLGILFGMVAFWGFSKIM